MQNDKEHLNVDLGFLDEAQPREAETLAKSGYKVNWRNIAIIGGRQVVHVAKIVARSSRVCTRISTARDEYRWNGAERSVQVFTI